MLTGCSSTLDRAIAASGVTPAATIDSHEKPGATPLERVDHPWTSLRSGSVERTVLWIIVDRVICSVVVTAPTGTEPEPKDQKVNAEA